MDIEKIYQKADELAQAITNSDLFKEYKKLQAVLLTDQQFLALLEKFQKEKEKFEEVSKYGKYHPDYGTVIKAYQETKIALMNYPLFKQFKQLEKDLDTLLYSVEEAIEQVIGIENKHKKSSLKFKF